MSKTNLRISLLIAVLVILYSNLSLAAKGQDKLERRLLNSDWVQLQSDNFIVISDAPEEYAQAFINDLESFRAAMPYIVSVPLKDSLPPIKVFAIRNWNNLKALQIDQATNGFFLIGEDKDYAVANLKGYRLQIKYDDYARHMFLHHYVHYLMHSSGSDADFDFPAWYQEGLANFLAAVKVNDGNITYGAPPESRLVGIDPGKTVPVEKLYLAQSGPRHGKPAYYFYSYSWLTTHFLFSNPQFKQKNQQYMELLGKGMAEPQAFQQAYGMNFDAFADVLNKHINTALKTWRLQPEGGLKIPSSSLHTLSQPQVAYELGSLQLARSSAKEGAGKLQAQGLKLLQHALELDKNYIDVQVTLLRRQLASDGPTASVSQQINTLVADYPKKSRVLALQGELLRRKGLRLTAARSSLRRAIAMDRNNAAAYRSLEQLYRDNWDALYKGERELQEYVSVCGELSYLRADPTFSLYAAQARKKATAVP